MAALRNYHWAWLASHPHRSEEWLRRQLLDGFDVHHVDGDHSNDTPDNLILIEHTDHMRAHGMAGPGRLSRGPKGPRAKTLERGHVAYLLRSEGKTWPEVRSAVGFHPQIAARAYAEANELVWPLADMSLRRAPFRAPIS